MSTQASKSLKDFSLKQVFTILSVTSFISRFFLNTRQIHNANPCNLYRRHTFYNKTVYSLTRNTWIKILSTSYLNKSTINKSISSKSKF